MIVVTFDSSSVNLVNVLFLSYFNRFYLFAVI